MKISSKLTIPCGSSLITHTVLGLVLVAFIFPLSLAHANYFTLPVDNATTTVTSWFDHDDPDYTVNDYFVRYDGTVWNDGSASLGSCTDGLNCYDGHNGIDFAAASGTDALAAADGEVAEVYWNSCGGWTMRVWHDDIGLSTLYAHIGTTTMATTSDYVIKNFEFNL